VRLYEPLADGEAQARAAGLPREAGLNAIEAVENFSAMFGRNARPLVRQVDEEAAIGRPGGEADGRIRGRVFDGVLEQVAQYGLDARRVSRESGEVRRDVERQASAGGGAGAGSRALGERSESARFAVDDEGPGLNLREIEQVGDEGAEAVSLLGTYGYAWRFSRQRARCGSNCNQTLNKYDNRFRMRQRTAQSAQTQ